MFEEYKNNICSILWLYTIGTRHLNMHLIRSVSIIWPFRTIIRLRITPPWKSPPKGELVGSFSFSNSFFLFFFIFHFTFHFSYIPKHNTETMRLYKPTAAPFVTRVWKQLVPCQLGSFACRYHTTHTRAAVSLKRGVTEPIYTKLAPPGIQNTDVDLTIVRVHFIQDQNHKNWGCRGLKWKLYDRAHAHRI